eukprot:jgi/Chrzof1/8579/Cz03g16070.t1
MLLWHTLQFVYLREAFCPSLDDELGVLTQQQEQQQQQQQQSSLAVHLGVPEARNISGYCSQQFGCM